MNLPLIVVTAGAGKTGQAVVRELRSRGLPVRALVRRRDARSAALGRLGAEIVETDLFDGDRMASALRGAQRADHARPDGSAGGLSDEERPGAAVQPRRRA